MTGLVVVPTYNESSDVLPLVQAVLDQPLDLEICVVDDSSPDGTSQIVASAIAERKVWGHRVSLVTRHGKGGRGGAVREGLERGLARDPAYDVFIEMDCDFSHDPKDLAVGTDLLDEGWDIAIGARYPDGTIIGWPLRRRIFSWFANALARLLIDPSVPDYTNGFRFYSRRAAEALISEPQRNTGYIYLSEALAVCLSAGMTVTSFPIVFRNRERGQSNTNASEIWAAARGILDVAQWFRSHRGTQR